MKSVQISLIGLMVACCVTRLAAEIKEPPTTDSVVGLTFSEVITVEKVASSNLFTRAKLWFAGSFKDSKAVLEVQDKEAGVLAGKGTLIYEPHVLVSREAVKGAISFAVRIMVKEGRTNMSFPISSIKEQHQLRLRAPLTLV